jgi:hypothetical protein
MHRVSVPTTVLAVFTSVLGCDRAETTTAAAPAIVAAAPAVVAAAPVPARTNVTVASADPSAPRTATAEEAAETALPEFVPAMADARIDGELACPEGTRLYRSDRAMHCAFAEARWGKGRHGPSLTFHPDGSLASQGEYRDGKAIGAIRDFDEQGRLVTYWEVDGDDRHGLSARFHPNGERASEGRFVHGKPDGVHKLWNEKGELMGTVTYREGERISDQMFAYTLEEMTPEQMEASKRDLAALLAEQKRLVENAN